MAEQQTDERKLELAEWLDALSEKEVLATGWILSRCGFGPVCSTAEAQLITRTVLDTILGSASEPDYDLAHKILLSCEQHSRCLAEE